MSSTICLVFKLLVICTVVVTLEITTLKPNTTLLNTANSRQINYDILNAIKVHDGILIKPAVTSHLNG